MIRTVVGSPSNTFFFYLFAVLPVNIYTSHFTIVLYRGYILKYKFAISKLIDIFTHILVVLCIVFIAL